MSNYEQLTNPYLGRAKKSYFSLILLLIASIMVGYGIYHVSTKHNRDAVKASQHYSIFVNEFQAKDKSKALNAFEELKTKFPHSPYAELAAMAMANVAVEQKDLQLAAERLLWVINKNKHSANAMIARVRLSKVYIANNQQQDAIDILKFDYPNSYKSLFAEAQGDFYLQKNDKPNAIKHYKIAAKSAPNHLPMPLLLLKLQNLGVLGLTE